MKAVHTCRFTLAACAAVYVAGLAAAQEPTPEPSPSLTPADSAILQLALDQGRVLPPSQVSGSPAAFWGVPTFPVKLVDFEDAPGTGRHLPAYSFRADDATVPPEYQGIYTVRGSDGTVVEVYLPQNDQPATQQIGSADALSIAQSYATQHYPAFGQGQWVLETERFREAVYGWFFRWYRVVDPNWGTRAADYVGVHVDSRTGKVVTFIAPDDAVRGPTAPQVSHADAVLLAQQVCPLPPAEFPFVESWLEMAGEGEQWPQWVFVQQTQGDEAQSYTTYVDALTGEVHTPAALGAVPGRIERKFPRPRLSPSFRWPRPLRGDVRLKLARGSILRGVFPPELRNGRVWTRIEPLQEVGVRLSRQENGFKMFYGRRLGTDNRALHAVQRENGWWVPIRGVAESFGWKVKWNAAGREAILELSPVISLH